jgi:hypothetical protein
MDRDNRLASVGPPHDLDLTGRHDEERHSLAPLFDEHLSSLDGADRSVRRNPGDLGWRERGEYVIDARSGT